MLSWKFYKFTEFTPDLLYDLLSLREQIFTFEQQCKEVDIDGYDKDAIHLVGTTEKRVVAAVYFIPPPKLDYVKIARLVVAKEQRGLGLGKLAMEKVLHHIKHHYPNQPIKLSAQLYLQKFYENQGFKPYTEVYDEGGIPHVGMQLTSTI